MTISLAQWTVGTGNHSGGEFILPQATGAGNAAVFIPGEYLISLGLLSSATIGTSSMTLSALGTSDTIEVFTLLNIPGSQTAITTSSNQNTDQYAWSYFEFSGVTGIDVITSFQGNLANVYNSGTVSTNRAPEAWVGAADITTDAQLVGNPAGNWTFTTGAESTYVAGYQIVSTTGNLVFNGSTNTNDTIGAAAIALYSDPAPKIRNASFIPQLIAGGTIR